MVEHDDFTAVVEATGVDTVQDDSRITRAERGGVATEDEELAGRKAGAVREGEGDAAEARAAQVNDIGASVLQFDELELISAGCADARRIIHDLSRQEVREILGGIERAFQQRAPGGAAAHARTDGEGEVHHDGSARRIDNRRGRDVAATEPRISAVRGEEDLAAARVAIRHVEREAGGD